MTFLLSNSMLLTGTDSATMKTQRCPGVLSLWNVRQKNPELVFVGGLSGIPWLFYYFFNLFYLFLAALGLRCCARAFSSCGKWGLPLVAVASLVAEHRL